MPRLFLVRHGRPAIAVDAPPETCGLDPAGFPDIDALAASGRLPERASWFSSPEPKAVETGRRLTSTPVVPAVRRILADHEEDDVVLVGHGTALTLLVSELTGREPDLEAWAALEMPDVWVISRPP